MKHAIGQNAKCTISRPGREEPLWQTILGCLVLAGLWAVVAVIL